MKCAVCDRALNRDNKSGVCAEHAHVTGFCKCAICSRRHRKTQQALTSNRSVDVVQVKIPVNESRKGQLATASVTMPAFPWDH